MLDKPVVNFKSDRPFGCKAGSEISFTTQTSETTLTYKWDFGDGGTSTDPNPKHIYNTEGYFTVTLVATNAAGCTETVSKYRYIYIGSPMVSLGNTSGNGCAPLHLNSPLVFNDRPEMIAEYKWIWGDGDTTTGIFATHTYTETGIFPIKLIYTTVDGCEFIVSGAQAQVGKKPDITVTATPAETCAFKGVKFTINSKDTITGAWWHFGDGGQTLEINPTYYYRDTGVFNVIVHADNFGCNETFVIEKAVHIKGPIALFTDSFSCASRNTHYFKNKSIDAKSIIWDFGDGSPTSSDENPVHTYAKPGGYFVTLTVKNDTCEHTTIKEIGILPALPDFAASATKICTGITVTYDVLTDVPLQSQWLEWHLGEGLITTGNSYLHNAEKTYSRPGKYDIKLYAHYYNGCVDSIIKPQYIEVNGPIADFTSPSGTFCTNAPVTFTDASTGNPSPLTSWQFDYGDGTVVTRATGGTFTHAYTQAGTYTATLTVTDNSGCSNSDTKYGVFNITKPISSFESPDLVSCENKPISFLNYSAGPITGYKWFFGDGNTSTDFQPTTAYSAEGLFDVKLVSTDIFGCTDTLLRPSYIKIANPRAMFDVSDSIASCPPLKVDFTNKSQNFNSYLWDFGDNTRPAPNENPTHFYPLPGTYFAKLKIISPGGCMDSMSQKLVVKGPEGSFTYDITSGCEPLVVNFKGTSKNTAEFVWDYNDGKVEPGDAEISHTYTEMGYYLPKMILVDPDGCRVPFPGIDTIKVYGAIAGFNSSNTILCDSGIVNFSNTSTANEPIIGYKWKFETGEESTEKDPSHFYNSLGRFPVELTVNTLSGCSDTYISTAPVMVAEKPIVQFNDDTLVCMPSDIQFKGQIIRTDTSLLKWAWNFGNGATAGGQNPVSALYREQRVHNVQLIATTSLGCKDTVVHTVGPLPIPEINAGENKRIPVGSSTQITATHSPGITSLTWDPIVELSCPDCPTPVASPKKTTTYTVEVTNTEGCSNKDEITIEVFCDAGNIFMPNTFSPNGDGVNDVYYPRGKGIHGIKALRIFNRWGELVFERRDFSANDISKGWNAYI